MWIGSDSTVLPVQRLGSQGLEFRVQAKIIYEVCGQGSVDPYQTVLGTVLPLIGVILANKDCLAFVNATFTELGSSEFPYLCLRNCPRPIP